MGSVNGNWVKYREDTVMRLIFFRQECVDRLRAFLLGRKKDTAKIGGALQKDIDDATAAAIKAWLKKRNLKAEARNPF